MNYSVEASDSTAATAALWTQLKARHGDSVRDVKLELVDITGYWFSYELANDRRRQLWCVRHGEVG